MERTNVAQLSKTLAKWHKDGKMNYDMQYQRRLCWDDLTKSMLIHSMSANYAIPSMFALWQEGQYHMLDGKQRMNCIGNFFVDGFALHTDTPDVDGVEIAGLTYSQLPDIIRETVDNYTFSIQKIENATEDELREMFLRLNSQGKKLTSFELTRVIAGQDLLGKLDAMVKMPLFEKVGITASQKNRYGDVELAIHILSMLEGYAIDFSAVGVKEYVTGLTDAGDYDKAIDIAIKITDYLNLVPLSDKWGKMALKKVHLPMVYSVVDLKVEPAVFAERLSKFYTKVPGEYKDASSSGTGKVSNVQKRLKILQDHFSQWNEPIQEEEPSQTQLTLVS